VILHGVLLWRQPGRKNRLSVLFATRKRKNATVGAHIAYNSLTPIYPGLTALNTPASQNFMNESTKGSP
jgi:hypothetical protein